MREQTRKFYLHTHAACAFALGLSACTTYDYTAPEHATGLSGLPEVETLGETIAREQQGEHGCLVAGNLDKGGRCEKLRETLFPPPPPTDPTL